MEGETDAHTMNGESLPTAPTLLYTLIAAQLPSVEP